MSDPTGAARPSPAPVSAALDAAVATVGDRWTLLVVAALLEGPRRFTELQGALPGVAPNVLSARLRHLERHGLLRARPYSRRPPRVDYGLTQRGQELAGAIRLLAAWDAEGAGGTPRHEACGTPMEPRWWCPTCGRSADDAETDVFWV